MRWLIVNKFDSGTDSCSLELEEIWFNKGSTQCNRQFGSYRKEFGLQLIPSLSKRQQRLCFSALNQLLSTLHFCIWDLHFPINKHLIPLTWLLWCIKCLQHFWSESRVLQHLTSERQSDQLNQHRCLEIHAAKTPRLEREEGALDSYTSKNKKAKGEAGVLPHEGKKIKICEREWTTLSLISSHLRPYMQYILWACLVFYRQGEFW